MKFIEQFLIKKYCYNAGRKTAKMIWYISVKCQFCYLYNKKILSGLKTENFRNFKIGRIGAR